MAGVEVGRFGREEEEGAGEIFRLTEPSLRHAGEETRAHGPAALVVGEHPFGEWRAENRRAKCGDGDAVAAEFAAESLGDAIDRRLRRAIGAVVRRMAEKSARRRHQNDLAAASLL